MRLTTLLTSLTTLTLALGAEIGIDTTHKVECSRKTQKGDQVAMHYRGTLQADGKEFDSSYKRNSPIRFKIGAGQMIKG